MSIHFTYPEKTNKSDWLWKCGIVTGGRCNCRMRTRVSPLAGQQASPEWSSSPAKKGKFPLVNDRGMPPPLLERASKGEDALLGSTYLLKVARAAGVLGKHYVTPCDQRVDNLARHTCILKLLGPALRALDFRFRDTRIPGYELPDFVRRDPGDASY